jgi:RNA polymerase sigma-70 factor, ECF subfamily
MNAVQLAPTSRDTVDLILGEENHLRRIARHLARCHADADDLVQETMMRAYRARDRFTPGTSIRAWTTTILRRVFLTNALRDRRRGVETDTDSGDMLETVPDRGLPDKSGERMGFGAVAEELDETVKRAVDRVPAPYREAFYLAVIKEMSCAEISNAVSIPEGTVMSRVHRARERLRADLANYEGRPRTRAVPVSRPRRLPRPVRPAAPTRLAPRSTAAGTPQLLRSSTPTSDAA